MDSEAEDVLDEPQENFSSNSIRSSKCEDLDIPVEHVVAKVPEIVVNKPITQSVAEVKPKKPKNNNPQIKDKEFYKAMQKIKERNTVNKPPKKPASAYILFQKEVSLKFPLIKIQKTVQKLTFLFVETSRNIEKITKSKSH